VPAFELSDVFYCPDICCISCYLSLPHNSIIRLAGPVCKAFEMKLPLLSLTVAAAFIATLCEASNVSTNRKAVDALSMMDSKLHNLLPIPVLPYAVSDHLLSFPPGW
jgi:hypothetical protein